MTMILYVVYCTIIAALMMHLLHSIVDGKYHEQIHIEHNSTGHSFENIFGRFLDKSVSEVEVEDPYIRNVHQV